MSLRTLKGYWDTLNVFTSDANGELTNVFVAPFGNDVSVIESMLPFQGYILLDDYIVKDWVSVTPFQYQIY